MKKHSREEVLKSSLEYFKGDELAATVWINKYSLKDNLGNLYELNPNEMHNRITNEISRVEQNYPNPIKKEEIFELLQNFKYIIPQGSPMAGIGNNFILTSLSNCFVVGNPFDSYPGILKTEHEMISLMKRRGGVGLGICSLRPRDTPTNGVSNKSSGIVLFSSRYSNTTREVAQDGRRGALMISCKVTHPDIISFIEAKSDSTKITGANISVQIDDDFMEAVINNTDYEVSFGETKEMISAKLVWDMIIKNAHAKAEPGVLFWDQVLRESPADCYSEDGFETTSTNPCFTGNMKLLTSNGYKSFEELYNVFNDNVILLRNISDTENCNGKVHYSGRKECIRLSIGDEDMLSGVTYFECTPDHILMDSEGNDIQAKDTLGKNLTTFIFGLNRVTHIDKIGERPVYDFSIEDQENPHWGVVQNIISHNCGEIPLCPYDSCRLLAINLLSYIDDPFTDHSSVNIDKLKLHVYYAQKMLDDIIDLEIEKIDKLINKITKDEQPEDLKYIELNLWKKIREKAVNGRRTGLGITAEGDMLAALGYKYGTPEATEMAEKVQKIISVESYKTSILLAKERGSFPIWDELKESGNPFIGRIIPELTCDDVEDYKKYGRRNISNLTIAPTGTTSLMTQTSSGIEPVFMVYYNRNRKVGDDEDYNFIDENGDKWEENKVVHNGFIDWFGVNYYEAIEDKMGTKTPKEYIFRCSTEILDKYIEMSPYHQATANDINWKESVKMQGRVQKWIDHSISKTINLPKGTTVETVNELYLEAWKSKCKGVTIYVDGCRSGVLTSGEENKTEEVILRSKELKCNIHHLTVNKQSWVVLVGILNDKPYEVFAFRQNKVEIPESTKEGILYKVRSNTYNLIVDGFVFKDLSDLFETEDEQTLTRQLSLSLRYNVPISEIADQLYKAPGTVVSFGKAIYRVLKKYIVDKAPKDKVCPSCGKEDALMLQEGCVSCKYCGYSVC